MSEVNYSICEWIDLASYKSVDLRRSQPHFLYYYYHNLDSCLVKQRGRNVNVLLFDRVEIDKNKRENYFENCVI